MITKISRSTLFMAVMLSFSSLSYSRTTTIYVATLAFPAIIQELPNMRAYFEGHKLTGQKDPEHHRVLFNVPAERSMIELYVLICEESSFESEDNTIKYLKIDPKKPYKLWHMTLMHKDRAISREPKKHTAVGKIQFQTEPDEDSPYYWIIQEEVVPEKTGRLPDNTLIILYNPAFIDHLEGGSAIELPRLVLTSELLALVGSEKDLHELSARYLLSALDLDPFHEAVRSEIKQDTRTNRITINTTT